MKKMTRIFAALLALVMLLGCSTVAGAEGINLQGEINTEAVAGDFCGAWSLFGVRSTGIVDMQSYGYLDIYSDGNVDVSIGAAEDGHQFSAQIEDMGNGIMAAEDAGSGACVYFFLTNEGKLGCMETMEDIQTIYYMECYNDMIEDEDGVEEEEYEDEGICILDYVEEQLYDVSADDFAGVWHAYECTNDSGRLYEIYITGMEMTLEMANDSARVTINRSGEETGYETPVTYESDYAEILDQEGEESAYLLLCEDGRLAMLDDLSDPDDVIFFLNEEDYQEAMAAPKYEVNPQPGARLSVDSIEAMAGEWEATHINYGGLLYPAASSGASCTLYIGEDGDVGIEEGDVCSYAEGRIEDGYLAVELEEGDENYYILFEGDYLIYAEDPEDLSMVVYFQRKI